MKPTQFITFEHVCPPFHSMDKPIVSFIQKTAKSLYWNQQALRAKHYKRVLCQGFEVIFNKYESNETTINPSHSVFQTYWGKSKCPYMVIEKGKIIKQVELIVVNHSYYICCFCLEADICFS